MVGDGCSKRENYEKQKPIIFYRLFQSILSSRSFFSWFIILFLFFFRLRSNKHLFHDQTAFSCWIFTKINTVYQRQRERNILRLCCDSQGGFRHKQSATEMLNFTQLLIIVPSVICAPSNSDTSPKTHYWYPLGQWCSGYELIWIIVIYRSRVQSTDEVVNHWFSRNLQ